MRDELSRARDRRGRVLLPEAAVSPMDCNPTIEVAAQVIAECLDEVDARSQGPQGEPVVDQGMLDAAAGRPLPADARRRDPA
ncbi:hypothetical protein [Nakamurella panacisegetis]|uniref:hypothetical protein n=1 Tax=Nakamurella panacisegetis TaxID=1090615 RepID=UPI0012FD6F24|nr:hypothetical protein [Nakamurella panacisegetis]